MEADQEGDDEPAEDREGTVATAAGEVAAVEQERERDDEAVEEEGEGRRWAPWRALDLRSWRRSWTTAGGGWRSRSWRRGRHRRASTPLSPWLRTSLDLPTPPPSPAPEAARAAASAPPGGGAAAELHAATAEQQPQHADAFALPGERVCDRCDSTHPAFFLSGTRLRRRAGTRAWWCAQARRYFPPATWVPEWLRAWRRWALGDVVAGLTVGMMLVPQAMAYAIVAGLEPIYGLYASLVPPVVYALLGTSRHLAVGPVALQCLMIRAVVEDTNPDDAEQYLLTTLRLAFLVGALTTAAGLLRLGFLVHFVSEPVLSGFTTATAFVIVLSQLRHLLGVDPGSSGWFPSDVYNLARVLPDTNPWTLVLSLCALAVLLAFRVVRGVSRRAARLVSFVPAPLVLVAAGIAASFALRLDSPRFGVALVGEVPVGWPPLAMPALPSGMLVLLPPAGAIALVGFVQSIAAAKKLAEGEAYKVASSQEMIAIGAANLVGSFFSSFPVTGSFSRSAVLRANGGHSQLAGLVAMGTVVAAVWALPRLLARLPNFALGAIVVGPALSMVQFARLRDTWRLKRLEGVLWCIAFLATLFVGTGIGILVSILASFLVVIYSTSRPHYALLGRFPQSRIFRNISRYDGILVPSGLAIVRIDAPLYFGNIAYVCRMLVAAVDGDRDDALEPVRCLVLEFSSVTDLDTTAARGLADLLRGLVARGVCVVVASVNGPVRDILLRAKIVEIVGASNFFWELWPAVRTGARWVAGLPTDDAGDDAGGPQMIFAPPAAETTDASAE